MYAVIETGGKQYRVELGSLLEVERLDAEEGQTVTLDRVLLVADGGEAAIGRPIVTDATVHAEVVRQTRGEKIDVFKYRPKARRRVKKGHRQELTVLRIADIRFNGRSAAELARQAEEVARTERQRLEEAAARQAAADRELAARLAAKRAQAGEAREAIRGGAGRSATPAAETTPEPSPETTPEPSPETTPEPSPETTPEPSPESGPSTSRGRGGAGRTSRASARPSPSGSAASPEAVGAEPAAESGQAIETDTEGTRPEGPRSARRTRTTKKDE